MSNSKIIDSINQTNSYLSHIDIYFMNIAIKFARRALKYNEVPVGCVVVKDNNIVGAGYNKTMHLNNVTLHAEIVALNAATKTLGTYRLNECTLYSTVEPCIMCCGAILHCRIERVVFGILEPKFGGVISCDRIFDNISLNHKTTYTYGLCEETIKQLMKGFFKNKR